MRQMRLTTPQVLICIICALLLFIYLRYPTTYSPGVDILQVPLTNFDPQLLLERYPVVIPDRIVDPIELGNSFKCLYTWEYTNINYDVPVSQARLLLAKYTLLYNQGSDTAIVSLSHPSNADTLTFSKSQHIHYRIANLEDTSIPTTALLLHPHQTVILPTNWVIISEHNKQLKEMYFYDIPHYVSAQLRRAFL
jgi:hypothetical protein